MIPIAVVGMDCRFPCATDIDELWRLLMDGAVAKSVVPAARWDIDRFHSPQLRPGTMNTRYAHFIDDADLFDHEFFGISPVEAAALDPQQRLVLQSVWRALEDAAIDPRALAGTDAGVFVGMMLSEWGALNLLDFPALTSQRGIGGGHSMVANRVSYHLNLIGPSVTVDTACSSSLTAVHLGCQALASGDTDLVVASGVNILLTPALSIFYTQAGLSAPDGTCKPFSANADGIGRGEGVGTVVLRRLEDAVADRQPIHSIIVSSATNQDGKSSGITAPNRWAQSKVMQRALDRAGACAGDVTFVEAHGTGTTLGDMIEANALGDLHRCRPRRAMPPRLDQGQHRAHRRGGGHRVAHQDQPRLVAEDTSPHRCGSRSQSGLAAGAAGPHASHRDNRPGRRPGARRCQFVRHRRQQRARPPNHPSRRGAARSP